MSWNRDEMRASETNIVWRKDISQYPWVRSSYADFPDRQKIAKSRILKIEKTEGILVGYAELEEDAPPSFIDEPSGHKYFNRRLFIIRHNDYENYKDGTYPSEAVETSTVQPKIAGVSPRKKIKAQIAVRVPQPLLRKLEIHIQRTGMSQTEIVISALANYLDSAEDIPIIDRLVALEKKVAVLEANQN